MILEENLEQQIFWLNKLFKGEIIFCGSVGIALLGINLNRKIGDIDTLMQTDLYDSDYTSYGEGVYVGGQPRIYDDCDNLKRTGIIMSTKQFARNVEIVYLATTKVDYITVVREGVQLKVQTLEQIIQAKCDQIAMVKHDKRHIIKQANDLLLLLNDSYVAEQRATLNKQQAIEALNEGKKVRHRYFDNHEWIRREGARVVFEDGVEQMWNEFWAIREQGRAWDDDWSIVE